MKLHHPGGPQQLFAPYNVMDPPERRKEPIKRQDANFTDLPKPLREDLYGEHFYDYLETFPDSDEAFLYQSTMPELLPPTNPQSKPPDHGEEMNDHQGANRPSKVHAPPIPLRTRLPSACLAMGPQVPPPLPPRTGIHTVKKQVSCDPDVHAYKLNRSRTEIDNHVSIILPQQPQKAPL